MVNRFDFKRANQNTELEDGWCERWAEQGFGLNEVYPSAFAAYKAASTRRPGLPPSDGNYYIIYFDGYYNDVREGDVAVYRNGKVWSGSAPQWRKPAGATLATYKQWLGTRQLAWSEFLGSHRIATIVGKSNQGESKVTDNQKLLSAPIYNDAFYKIHNPDLAKNGVKTVAQRAAHWLKYGIREGRIAVPNFRATEYINNYPDLKKLFNQPEHRRAGALHYFNHGINEGRAGRKRNPVVNQTSALISQMQTVINKFRG